jgi:hypothetical protein
MATLLFAGPALFDIQYNMVREPLYNEGMTPTNRMQHHTLLFHTFILMQLFNMLNSRIIGASHDDAEGTDNQFNIFRRIHHNWWFVLILLVELNI